MTKKLTDSQIESYVDELNIIYNELKIENSENRFPALLSLSLYAMHILLTMHSGNPKVDKLLSEIEEWENSVK